MSNKFQKRLKELPSQPDIIFIITDQERATQHFPDNWEKDNLSTMTFLKENGFSFDRAFCNSCMCSPSRSTLFTGLYPAQHQVTQTLTDGGIYSPGEIQLNPQTPNIARLLEIKETGDYRNGFIIDAYYYHEKDYNSYLKNNQK